MGPRLALNLVCGIDVFPLDDYRNPLVASRFHIPPCYLPPEGYGPIHRWEHWNEPVPLPVTADWQTHLAWGKQRAMSPYADVCWRQDTGYHLVSSHLEGKSWQNALYWRSDEYGMANLIGYRIEQSYDTELLYALATILPEMSQKGYRALPPISYEESTHPDTLALKRIIAAIHAGNPRAFSRQFWREENNRALFRYAMRKKRELTERHCYSQFPIQWLEFQETARYLFSLIGLHVRTRDLKLLLVWTWS